MIEKAKPKPIVLPVVKCKNGCEDPAIAWAIADGFPAERGPHCEKCLGASMKKWLAAHEAKAMEWRKEQWGSDGYER